MKKFLVLLVVVGMFLSTGCDIPAKKNLSDVINEYTKSSNSKAENSSDSEDADSITMEKDDTIRNGAEKQEDTNSKKDAESLSEKEKNKTLVILYYQNASGYVVPVTRKVVKQEGIAKAAVSALVDDSVNREEIEYFGLYPVLPVGTEVLGVNIKAGTASVDFNSSFLNYDSKIAERNIVSAVVYTLTEFKTVDNVKILVNGSAKGKLKYGTDVSGLLSRKNTLVNFDRINLKQGMAKSDIYLFYNTDNYSYLTPLSIEYNKIDEGNIPAKIVELLSKKYDDKKLHSEIPPKTILLNSTIDGNMLTLDFSEEIKSYGGGTAREEGILKQLLFSMKQIKGIDKVKMLIEGNEGSLPEGMDISKEIPIPAEINNYIDK